MSYVLGILGYLFAAGVMYRAVERIMVPVEPGGTILLVLACLLWGVTLPAGIAACAVWLIFRVAARAVDQTAALFERKDDHDGS